MIPDLYNMLSIAFIGMAQAVDIRGKDLVSPHLTNIYENIRKDVKPLYEDRRMDFDIEKVYTLIEMKKFI
jgi:histidine ammonia-lyase